ncbi:hypothetical protein SALWKB2_1061 [Snodgrassella alvi wkB2]|nr:hypothetical protein SALWKB2_1061 [Snodgrassella alvi wkB2]
MVRRQNKISNPAATFQLRPLFVFFHLLTEEQQSATRQQI